MGVLADHLGPPTPAPLLPWVSCYSAAATTEIYTLSLHDALPIWRREAADGVAAIADALESAIAAQRPGARDRKSTRLNSSHVSISYAVFCLKKKKKVNDWTREHTKKDVIGTERGVSVPAG